jgi:tRNA-splicing ligase RtcB (3'-phosphate/5'-hydroxy nucleic acid ligase)
LHGKKNHDGQDYWVVRKGATPAFPGQRGFVGGSMGDISVIIKGVDSPKAKEALYSTVHGAGRLMSRTEAAGKVKWVFDPKRKKKMPTRISEGKVNETSMRQKNS